MLFRSNNLTIEGDVINDNGTIKYIDGAALSTQLSNYYTKGEINSGFIKPEEFYDQNLDTGEYNIKKHALLTDIPTTVSWANVDNKPLTITGSKIRNEAGSLNIESEYYLDMIFDHNLNNPPYGTSAFRVLRGVGTGPLFQITHDGEIISNGNITTKNITIDDKTPGVVNEKINVGEKIVDISTNISEINVKVDNLRNQIEGFDDDGSGGSSWFGGLLGAGAGGISGGAMGYFAGYGVASSAGIATGANSLFEAISDELSNQLDDFLEERVLWDQHIVRKPIAERSREIYKDVGIYGRLNILPSQGIFVCPNLYRKAPPSLNVSYENTVVSKEAITFDYNNTSNILNGVNIHGDIRRNGISTDNIYLKRNEFFEYNDATGQYDLRQYALISDIPTDHITNKIGRAHV